MVIGMATVVCQFWYFRFKMDILSSVGHQMLLIQTKLWSNFKVGVSEHVLLLCKGSMKNFATKNHSSVVLNLCHHDSVGCELMPRWVMTLPVSI